MSASASRPVSDLGLDDIALPFAVQPLDVRGRVVRLGPAIDAILARHAYPAGVARLLGEAVTLTVLLGASLKIEGRFQLQTRSDGPVDMLVVDFDAPDRVRAFARYDAARLAGFEAMATPAALLGKGHLAFTIEQGGDMSRYQGVVALNGQGLEEAAHEYFRQSEQIPTFIRLAVAENVTGEGTAWRAGGLMIQFLPSSPERLRQGDLHPGDAPQGVVPPPPQEDDAWAEAKALSGTLEEHERVQVQEPQRRVGAAFADAIAAVRPTLARNELDRPLAMLLFGMINWMFTWLRPDGSLTHEQMAPLVADLFFGGLAAVRKPRGAARPTPAFLP